ncbi:MAG: chitobiase/beta-hexosaminidase C-terminal domain-containing protein [Prevotella sp.]|nr:chitobiase/beta-hexosaminidase C-terminal domain-containing protein [Prevotella sp.]
MKQKIHYLFMLLLMILTGVGGVKAQNEITVSKTTFTSASGSVDDYIKYEGLKGTASTAAACYSNELRIYQNGGILKVSVWKEGAKIKSVTVGSSSATNVAYSVDGGEESSSQSISKNGSITVAELNCETVSFICKGTDSKSRLNVNNLSVSYVKDATPADPRTPVSLSFPEETFSVTLNEGGDFPQLSVNPEAAASEVVYSSSNPEVAEVANDGVVTPVAAGTTTITAKIEDSKTYKDATASYELTVNPAPVEGQLFYESFNKFNGTGGNDNQWSGSIASAAWGDTDNDGWTNEKGYSAKQCAKFGASSALGKATTPTISIPSGNATLTFKAAAWSGDAATLNLSVSDGSITPATITMKSGEWSEYTIAISGTQETTITFEGNTASKSRFFLDEVRIVEVPAAAVESPTFSVPEGTYFETQTVELSCATDGATIYYTLDGTDPSTTSTKYTAAITIDKTTTLKAIAIKDGQSSNVVSATYTIPTTYTTIAAFKDAKTSACLNLTGAQVVYIDEAKKNIYVRDASAAICLYNRAGFTFEEGKELKAGDILSGTIYGKYALYNNLPEVTEIQNFDKLAVTDNKAVTPKSVSSATEIAANMCDLVKIAKTQITETDSKFYVLDVQLYDKLKLGYTPEIGVDASITGVVTDFNNTTEIFPRTLDDIAYYPAVPTFSPEAGTFTAAQDVTISTTTDGAEIYYTTDGSEPTTSSSKYSAAIPVNSSTTIKAIAVKNELSSEVAEATYTIEIPVVEPGTPAAITAGFYTIKNLGNNQFVNVAGRKTVTFVGETATATAPGTVIKVESNEKGQVQVLRSQGVDLPGYAERAMKYVPKVVQLVAEKLGAEGEGNLLGKDGLGKIMDKFNESFDYHLYTEQGEQGVRIYGKTPSMQPVVDFYNDNKANVDAKLPMLEDFINSAINKVLEKTGGSGASILTKFSLYEIWEKMGKTLTKPVDADSKLAFLQDVLSDKKYVWDFAYQTAMKYWKPLISHEKVQQNLSQLGDLAQYVEKIEYIRPDVKYYIVQKNGKIDFISQDNTLLKEASSEWKLTARETFTVNFDEANYTLSGKDTKAYYTTAYTDFAYDLPEGVKAYTVSEVKKLEGVSDKYYAVTNAVEGTVPAQTPVLLVSSKTSADLDLNVNDGTAIENELKGNDWLVNKLEITTPQVDKLFGIVHDLLEYEKMGSLYDQYVKEYEYLKKRNAGTVNNKYFFALSGDDIAEATMNIGQLAKDELGLAFTHNLGQSAANKAFLPSDNDPVYLSIIGDVNRDGKVNISDVTAQVNIILGKDKPEDNYDYDAADVDRDGEIRIGDVTELVNIILGKKSL